MKKEIMYYEKEYSEKGNAVSHEEPRISVIIGRLEKINVEQSELIGRIKDKVYILNSPKNKGISEETQKLRDSEVPGKSDALGSIEQLIGQMLVRNHDLSAIYSTLTEVV